MDFQTLPGPIAARYRVKRELSGGGMSSVYLAEDIKHGRQVAVKVLRRDLGQSLAPERFLREIELTARLTHPNILPLLDSGEMDGRAYYVMPFIEGESLRDLLSRQQRLPPGEAMVIAREVADALAYAHARDVVHRDIKPENILLSAGHAVVADFGIARAISPPPNGNVTVAGMAVGTPTYMSPEQALGEHLDGRTDVYSLGCVLYEMLVGEVPFRAATAVAMLARKIGSGRIDVASLPADVPRSVGVLIQHALARDADERIRSAREFIELLDAARAGDSTAPTVIAPAASLPAANTLAVLPFTAMSSGSQDEFLGDGISEELMHALTQIGGLRVVARTSAFSFRKTDLDVREIGRRLNVRRIVEGSVRRAGDRIRVTAKLIDADTAFEIWSERFDRQVDDLLAIEDEIATAIARSLKAILLADTGQHIPTVPPARVVPATSFAAYEQYLKGRHFWGLRTEDGLRKSAECLTKALEIDPSFAVAYAAMADTMLTLGLYGMAAPREVMPLALEAAEHALSLDPSLAEALTARGCVRAIYEWDWPAAEWDFKQAIALNPQYPTAHQWYAMHCLVPVGRFTEARAALATARELDPLSLSIAVSRAAIDYYDRRFGDAVRSAGDVLALGERFAMGHYFLGLALEQEGRWDMAQDALARAASLSPSIELSASLAHARALGGDRDIARLTLAELERQAQDRYGSPVLLAQIATGLGEHDRALDYLELARTERAADLIWLAVRPVFDPLRSEPRFMELISSLHLPLDVHQSLMAQDPSA